MPPEMPVQGSTIYPVQPLKNPGVAAVLSFCLPGLGQIYNGQIMWGIIYLVVVMPGSSLIALGMSMALASTYVGVGVYLPLLLPAVMWIGNVVDAYKSAESINQRRHMSLNAQAR